MSEPEQADAVAPAEEPVAAPEISTTSEAIISSDASEIQPAPENKEQDPKEIAKAKKKAAEEAAEAKRKAAEEALEAKRRLLAEEDAKRRAAAEEARRVAEAKRQAELEELKKEASTIYHLDDQAVPQMTSGFIGITQPMIDSCCSKLSELQSAQTELIELLAQEDRKVMTLPHMAEVAQVITSCSFLERFTLTESKYPHRRWLTFQSTPKDCSRCVKKWMLLHSASRACENAPRSSTRRSSKRTTRQRSVARRAWSVSGCCSHSSKPNRSLDTSPAILSPNLRRGRPRTQAVPAQSDAHSPSR